MFKRPHAITQATTEGHSAKQWILFILGGALFFVFLYYLAFQYTRLTDFPVGDDPAIHIFKVQTLSYRQLAQEIYPLPLMIFKFIGSISHLQYPQLFTILISNFLFLSGVSLFFLVWKGFNNWPAAIITSLFFVTDRWVNDSLRMGTLGETFGWVMLPLAVYAIAKQNFPLTLLISGLLAFSHPFAFAVFVFIVLLYFFMAILSSDKKERRFALYLMVCYSTLGLIAWFLKPDLVQKFLEFKSAEPAGWGERSLWEIIAGDDIRRVFIPFFSVIGLLVAMKEWQKPITKLAYLIVIIGLFLSLNHLYGIRFLPFRFYGYLVMGLSIFAGLGISWLIRGLRLPNGLTLLGVTILGILFASPNYHVNEKYLQWQTTDPNAHAIMLPPDREALEWIKNNTPSTATFISARQYGIWITAVSERPLVTFSNVPYDQVELKTFLNSKQKLPADYIYYSLVQKVPKEMKTHYREVYSKDGIVILKVKNGKK